MLRNILNKCVILGFFLIFLTSCRGYNEAHICSASNGNNRVRRSIIDPYAAPPFAPFGATPPFGFFPPFPPPFPPPPFPPPFGGTFPPPLGPPLPLAPPPVLPSPFPSPFPLPFYPPAPAPFPPPPPPFGYPFAPPGYPFAPPPPPPPPPAPVVAVPAPAAAPAPAPIILPAHTAATLSVASLLHALIAKKFYPPVVPFPIPRPVPFPVTVKVPVPVPVPVERPEHVTILRPAPHYEEPPPLHEDAYHEMENEWNSAPPDVIHGSK